jgi:RHS repeat-associated protein
VVSDKKLFVSDHWESYVLSAQDYYPFGMSMPGRKHSGGTYRYGFNGKETDSETGIQDYGMRWYLPNIARFASVDPLTASYPELTPYQFASNRPIDGADLDGLEWSVKTINYANGWQKVEFKVHIKVVNSSKIVSDAEVLRTANEQWKKAVENTFSKIDMENKTDYMMSVEFEFLKPDEVSPDNDFYIDVVDEKTGANGKITTGRTNGGIGETNINRITIAGSVDGKPALQSPTIDFTVAHELGHSGGLKLPHDESLPADDPTVVKYKNHLINNNLMIQGDQDKDKNPMNSTGLTASQMQKIQETVIKKNPMIIERRRTNPGNTGVIQQVRVPNPNVQSENVNQNYEPNKKKSKVE